MAEAGSISASSRADLDILCSFTVPAELLCSGANDVVQHLQEWGKEIGQGMSNGLLATLWDRVRVEVSVSRHTVVL